MFFFVLWVYYWQEELTWRHVMNSPGRVSCLQLINWPSIDPSLTQSSFVSNPESPQKDPQSRRITISHDGDGRSDGTWSLFVSADFFDVSDWTNMDPKLRFYIALMPQELGGCAHWFSTCMRANDWILSLLLTLYLARIINMPGLVSCLQLIN